MELSTHKAEVVPIHERNDDCIGRVKLKCINPDYLLGD